MSLITHNDSFLNVKTKNTKCIKIFNQLFTFTVKQMFIFEKNKVNYNSAKDIL